MTATTIVFAREDLSIPGAPETPPGDDGGAPDAGAHFFALVRDSNPDVIVLDLSSRPSVGVATILKIRRHCEVPILVVCDPSHPKVAEFRIAGAADCIATPIDLLDLNDRLQQIIRVTQRTPQWIATPNAFTFAGLTFYPYRDLLAAQNAATLTLTTSECRLLRHFVAHPWRLCPRAELAAVLYGNRLSGDRAIDVVINRLRRKLVLLRGAAARTLIKTEFRRGYLLVAAVSTAEGGSEADAAA
jgi:DNA-binding response OmpR family regulator